MFDRFNESLSQKIIDTYGGRQVGTHLRNIKCPSCGEPEAYSWHYSPREIHCPRLEACGVKHSTRTLFPDHWERISEKYPASNQNHKATAEAYLAIHRGIDPAIVEFNQCIHKLGEKEYSALCLPVVGMNQRFPYRVLIDCPKEIGNKRWEGGEGHGGLYYDPEPATPLQSGRDLFIAEKPIDAISLKQAGERAVSVFSAGEIPEKLYEKLDKQQPIKLAFDNDSAGKQGAVKNYQFLIDNEFENVSICLPPRHFKDWNEMLLKGDDGPLLNEEKKLRGFKEGEHLGRLALAKNAREYFDEVCNFEGSRQPLVRVFEFGERILKGVQKNPMKRNVVEISDRELAIRFREIDDLGSHSYHIQVGSHKSGNKPITVEMRAEDMLTNKLSEIMISKTEAIVTQSRPDQQLLYKHLMDKGGIDTITSTGLYGHDPKSNWYVFSNVAVDPSGGLHRPVPKADYFKVSDGKFIRPFTQVFSSEEERIVRTGEPFSLMGFVNELHEAYGPRGLLCAGFYIASLFSTHIFNTYRCFPFLSLVGEPNIGKTTLAILLSRAFSFSNREGVALGETNTKKGIGRTISAHSSIALALTEWTNQRDFAEGALKNMYGRGAIQTRAAFSNDNRTISLPLRCALVFVWNTELFTMKPVIQRTITARFTKEMMSDKTREAANKLIEYSPELMATVGEQVLQNRLDYEKDLVGEIEKQVEKLKQRGIEDQRIGRNHAFVLAALSLFLRQAGWNDEQTKGCMEQVTSVAILSAESKIKRAKDNLPNADLCLQTVWEAYRNDDDDEENPLRPEKWIRVEFQKGCRAESEGPELYFHLPTFLDRYPQRINKNDLQNELQRHVDFIGTDTVKFAGKSRVSWVFKIPPEQQVAPTGEDNDDAIEMDSYEPEFIVEAAAPKSDLDLLTDVFQELENQYPHVKLDDVKKACQKRHSERFGNASKWKQIVEHPSYVERFVEDHKTGFIKLRQDPYDFAPDDLLWRDES